ncbi:uncharacterized protein LOC130669408 isoform X1 [Microplitis mediator]|uniref:uncharacterized protein LOC130669408 isoform X1 n=1 Tax=Microplitis mediator TaxID=375433 RepID=UPI002556FF82|nr:uncharacterized protein LOC130669408 isoform X1 [Microplitis mediator]
MMHNYVQVVLLFVVSEAVTNLPTEEVNGTIATLPMDSRAKIEIQPQFTIGMGRKFILKRDKESLNLTCTVVKPNGEKNDLLHDYIVDWKTPFHENHTLKVERGQRQNVAWLWFEKLSEKHDGNYTCIAITFKHFVQPHLSVNIHLSVKKKPTFCGAQWFRCYSNNCIMERYLCDGKDDCEEGEDESQAAGCGDDPCYGKILCEDRCVPPEWCCNRRSCSTNFGLRSWPTESHEISYIQTAFYVVIGCAMAFMFIVTILAIAVCRVQFKRAMITTRHTQQNRGMYHQTRRSLSENIRYSDINATNMTTDDLQRERNIMHNINGVRSFVDRPMGPPSYSEVIALPSREEPPPLYVSCEDLNENLASRVYDLRNICQSTTLPAIINNRNSYRSDTTDTPSSGQVPLCMPVSLSSTGTQSHDNLNDDIAEKIKDLEPEYADTDALLTENNEMSISKETVWNASNRHEKFKTEWLVKNFSDAISDNVWLNHENNQTNQRSPLEVKSFSLGDVRNEGLISKSDQRKLHSNSLIISSHKLDTCSSVSPDSSCEIAGPSSLQIENDVNLNSPVIFVNDSNNNKTTE